MALSFRIHDSTYCFMANGNPSSHHRSGKCHNVNLRKNLKMLLLITTSLLAESQVSHYGRPWLCLIHSWWALTSWHWRLLIGNSCDSLPEDIFFFLIACSPWLACSASQNCQRVDAIRSSHQWQMQVWRIRPTSSVSWNNSRASNTWSPRVPVGLSSNFPLTWWCTLIGLLPFHVFLPNCLLVFPRINYF